MRLYKTEHIFCFSWLSFKSSLSNTASCLTMEHSISYHPSHWLGEKKRENAFSATLYRVYTLCLRQHKLNHCCVTKGGGDIYQHHKQFQH